MVGKIHSYCHRRFVAALLAFGVTAPLSVVAQGPDLPDWLGGKPDTTEHADRCALYAWFLEAADEQTDDRASADELARKRVINIANKLADHYRETDEADGQQAYAGRVKYLMFSQPRPYHFSFRLKRQQLQQLLGADCPDDAPG